MKIVNLTPHDLKIIAEDKTVVISTSGNIARVTSTVQTEIVDVIKTDDLDIPITTTVFGAVEGLPDPEPDTVFVVSTLVASRCPGRKDLLVPRNKVRNKEGKINWIWRVHQNIGAKI